MTAAQPEVVIRNFQASDGEAFRLLNEAWIAKHFRLEEKDRQTLNDPQHYILDKGGHILVAERGCRPVGCCALLAMEDGAFEVAKMTVSENERGKGVGRQLLEQVVEFAKTRSIPRLYLETNTALPNAIRLYELVGFRHLPAERVKPSPYARANVFMEMPLR